MDELVVMDEDALNVFDRGYLDYKKFDNYCVNGTRFITRLKSNAKIEAIKKLPVSPTSLIKKHQIVCLGTKGINQMQHHLRLIEDIEGVDPVSSFCDGKDKVNSDRSPKISGHITNNDKGNGTIKAKHSEKPEQYCGIPNSNGNKSNNCKEAQRVNCHSAAAGRRSCK